MQWNWATSLDQLLRAPNFPIWAALAAACFFGLVLLITIIRAEKSVANGALAIITLLSIGIAAATNVKTTGTSTSSAILPSDSSTPPAALAALACLDGWAGSEVESACERTLFASAESSAAAVSYAARQIASLEAGAKDTSVQRQALRRAVERDRYGFVAQALSGRNGCTPADCPAFQLVTDATRLKSNMNERLYASMITRYSANWDNASSATALANLPPSVPSGKPSTVDFPSAASIPPVNIMTPEPPPAAVPAPRPPPAQANAQAPVRPAPAAKKPVPNPAPKPRVIAPVAPAPPPGPN